MRGEPLAIAGVEPLEELVLEPELRRIPLVRARELAVPAVLVAGHGPFCWGESAAAAAHNAVLLEEIAAMAYYTVALNHSAPPISRTLLDKHFLRKHGAHAYYGQK